MCLNPRMNDSSSERDDYVRIETLLTGYKTDKPPSYFARKFDSIGSSFFGNPAVRPKSNIGATISICARCVFAFIVIVALLQLYFGIVNRQLVQGDSVEYEFIPDTSERIDVPAMNVDAAMTVHFFHTNISRETVSGPSPIQAITITDHTGLDVDHASLYTEPPTSTSSVGTIDVTLGTEDPMASLIGGTVAPDTVSLADMALDNPRTLSDPL